MIQRVLSTTIACCLMLCVKAQRPLFSLLTGKQTNLFYENIIIEDDTLNVLRYEYLYNGAGVATADFNNDGKIDVFFSGNTAPNKLFINKGNFQFEDVTKVAGVAGNGTWATGVSVADVNGDGLLDIYVCHSGKYTDSTKLRNQLFINQGMQNGVPVFADKAIEYKLDAAGTQSTQAVFFDYDRDGDLDMFLLNHSNHTYNSMLNTRKTRAIPNPYFGNRLFRQDQDANGYIVFNDVTLPAGIINHALNYGLSVTVSDLNNDGWPDIYTTSDYAEKDALYINNQNGTFSETLEKSMPHIAKYAMGTDIADYNNDGWPDVVTLDMLPEDNRRQKLLKGPDEFDQYHLLLDSGYHHQQMRNMLQLNHGVDSKGYLRFSEIGQLAGISNTDWSWAALFADFDGDGWKDLFVTNGYLRDFTDMDFLKYTVADAKFAAAREGHQNFQTVDLVKKMPSNKLHNYIFQNNKDLRFVDKTQEWGLGALSISNAAAYADLDNDGDLDLIVCNNNEPAQVYRNNVVELGNAEFLIVRLTGDQKNLFAYGARVQVTSTDGLIQLQEITPVRGYQSSVTTDLHFGLPKGTQIREIKVIWPDGSYTLLKDAIKDKLIRIKKDRAENESSDIVGQPKIFEDVTAVSGMDFKHTENDFIDFKEEVLLPYQLSRQGPALAKGDVNNDGLDDVFVGGAIGQAGVLYLQTQSGKFVKAGTHSAFDADSDSEDVNAVFFDADNDGDLDLYVVSGGNEYGEGSPEYADRLYINDGKGGFTKAANAIPEMLSSKEAVAVGDFDKDGLPDLFIGGKAVPGAFPVVARSYLLKNESRNGVIRFKDVTAEVSPSLLKPGMVNVALWNDLNDDGYPELMIAGDWMTTMLFRNNNGKLVDITGNAGLDKLQGMWSSIIAGDVNGDGLVDFVLGNCGLNNQFKANRNQPMSLHAADFDGNGTVDPIVCYYIQGVSYPMASRDELLDQMNGLKKRFVMYKDYADIRMDQLFTKKQLKQANVLYCTELASGVLINKGSMKFSFEPLPVAAQFSRVYGIDLRDYNADGKNDLLVTGNFFPYRTQLGRADAGIGTLLLADEKGMPFRVVNAQRTGLFAANDIRRMVSVTTSEGKTLLILASNNDYVQVIKVD